MEVVFAVLLTVGAFAVLVFWLGQREHKRRKAAILCRLMCAESERERLDLKYAALQLGMVLTEADDHDWRMSYLDAPEKQKACIRGAAQAAMGAATPEQALATYAAHIAGGGTNMDEAAKRRGKAETLLSLMFAENEQTRTNLKAAALECGLTITGEEDHIWRTGYLLMSAADRDAFQMMAWMMINGFPLPSEALAASDDLLAYLRSHGVRPRDVSKEFWEARGFYVSEGDIRKRSLR